MDMRQKQTVRTGGAQKILPVHKAAPGVCDHADARFAGGKEEAEGHGAHNFSDVGNA